MKYEKNNNKNVLTYQFKRYKNEYAQKMSEKPVGWSKSNIGLKGYPDVMMQNKNQWRIMFSKYIKLGIHWTIQHMHTPYITYILSILYYCCT